MNLAVSVVNCIRARGLSHCQFKKMLNDFQADFQDVACYCKRIDLVVRRHFNWFFGLFEPIESFMRIKGQKHEKFSKANYLACYIYIKGCHRSSGIAESLSYTRTHSHTNYHRHIYTHLQCFHCLL